MKLLDSTPAMPHTRYMTTRTSTQALYPRIVDFQWDERCGCCGEPFAICPDCGHTLCVFSDDECEGCGGSLF